MKFIKNYFIIALIALAMPLVQCTSDSSGDKKLVDTEYSNPVIRANVPDPSLIRVGDYFYLYCTEGSPMNMPIYRSENLTDWELVSTAFTDATRPTMVPGGRLWAPSINYISGVYVLYYAMAVWREYDTCGIGVAVADSPAGPFTDMGALFFSSDIGVRNSIDACYIEDNGRKYLFWGSFFGLYYIELTEDGMSIKEGSEPVQVAGTLYEGVYLHKRNGYYYMFASIGTCCDGINSTYTTVVGRSDNLFGPYLNKAGERMLDNRHEILIDSNERYYGVGHDSEIVQDNAGNDWILYHGYDVMLPDVRSLMLNRIEWENDWPVVEESSTPARSERPAF